MKTRHTLLLLLLLALLSLNTFAAEKKFFATVDIEDNYWKTFCTFRGPESPEVKPLTAGSYTLENMRQMVDAVADMGFTRLYWISCPAELRTNGLPVFDGDKLVGGRDLLKELAAFCHARGIEFFVILKPFENGAMMFPPGTTPPPGMATIERTEGTCLTDYPIVVANPEIRLRRRLSPRPADDCVATVTLISSGTAPITLTRDDVTFFAGSQNGVYREITDFTVESIPVIRDERLHSALQFRPQGLTSADKFFLIKCAKKNAKPELSNDILSILELRNAAGEVIPRSVGTGAITREGMLQSMIHIRLMHFQRDTRVPKEWEPPEEYGSCPEKTAYEYDCAPSIPSIQLDGRNGYIAFASVEMEYLSSLHPAYPEVMALWKQCIEDIADADADGVDIRFGDHASWTVYGDDYGFNEPVVQEFKRRYGVDVLTDDTFDRALWRKLSGETITDFMRWSAELLHGRGKRLHAHVALPIFDRDFWTRNDAPENFKYEWKKWMEERIVDGISLKYMPFPWGSKAGTGTKSAQMLCKLAQKYGVETSIEARTIWWIQPTDSNSPPFTDEQYNNYLKEFSGMMKSDVDALNFYEVSDYFMIDAYGKPQHAKRFIELLNDVREAGK